MVFLWFSYGFPMVFLWFSYGFPMVSGHVFVWDFPKEPRCGWMEKLLAIPGRNHQAEPGGTGVKQCKTGTYPLGQS